MIEITYNWTDHGTAEDHADRLEELSMQVGKAGRYNESATLHVSSNCIRYLSAKAEVLEKENDAAEAEIDRLSLKSADMKCTNEALRIALRSMLDEHDVPTSACVKARLALAAHDKGEE